MFFFFLQDYFIEISNDNEVLSVAQKITAYIARQCQVTTVRMHVDHYVFIIHEINMYYHRCMHVCLHVYRLFVYVCATVHVWVHVCVCMCVNKYKYTCTCTCRSVISYLLLSKQCTCNQFTIHFIMFIIYTYTCVHCRRGLLGMLITSCKA